jgi:hypothetical protein
MRPAAFAALVAGLFVAGILGARAAGAWRNSISDEEYARRIREIDSPAYAHDRGRVPSRSSAEGGPGAAPERPPQSRPTAPGALR